MTRGAESRLHTSAEGATRSAVLVSSLVSSSCGAPVVISVHCFERLLAAHSQAVATETRRLGSRSHARELSHQHKFRRT